MSCTAERAPCAITLEEAWVWGFPVDAWRAHITAITWPEVLREFVMASGMGCLRPRAGKEPKPGDCDQLILKMPVNFQPKTINAALWTVCDGVVAMVGGGGCSNGHGCEIMLVHICCYSLLWVYHALLLVFHLFHSFHLSPRCYHKWARRV